MKLKNIVGLALSCILVFSSLNISYAEEFNVSQDNTLDSLAEDDANIKYEVEGGYIYFDKNKGAVTMFDETVTSVVIPETIEGVSVKYLYNFSPFPNKNLVNVEIPSSVTFIDVFAFSNCSNLTEINVNENNTNYTSVDGVLYDKNMSTLICCPSMESGSFEIPSSVTSIGLRAFEGCSNLTSIEIPSSVTNIDLFAFNKCSGLTSIEIPSGVTEIGDNAFSECIGLTDICVDANNDNYTSVEGVLYDKNIDTLISCPVGKMGKFDIPMGVTDIADYAFFGCINLTDIEIPSSVTSIGRDVVWGCSKDLIIYCQSGSYAEEYAKKNGIKYSNTTTSTTGDTTKDIKVTIGSTEVKIGDDSYEIDAAPYIQSTSSSILVPLRFVTVAILGGDVDNANDSSIVEWDAEYKNANVYYNGKTIQFKADSNTMIIAEGVMVDDIVNMDNDVKAEIKDGKMYVPFRALGKALGVNVDWDADTKTAIYKAK